MSFLLLIAALAATPPSSPADAVERFGCSDQAEHKARITEISAAYGKRSVAILQVGLDGDSGRLGQMVSPDAEFSLIEGDVGTGPETEGARGAIDFAQRLAPKHFQYGIGTDAPWQVDACGEVSAELRLWGDRESEAIEVEFKFEKGKLIEPKQPQHPRPGHLPAPQITAPPASRHREGA